MKFVVLALACVVAALAAQVVATPGVIGWW